MNNLYNKIYEAINAGIQKALILDPYNDVSIKWHEKEKTNNINLINQLVNDLLNEDNDEYNYKQIIEYYNNTGYKYKCNGIDELFNIFKKIKYFNFNTFPNNFCWVDTKNAMSLILDTDEEISLSDYTKDMNPLFLKISNSELRINNNDILIYIPDKHGISNEKYQWQVNFETIQNDAYIKDKSMAIEIYDGYEACQKIINHIDIDKIPQIKYCMEFDTKTNGHYGYLPSIGQLKIMYSYLDIINYVFSKMHVTSLNIFTDIWPSSTENSLGLIWALGYGSITNNMHKKSYFQTLPIFTL